MQVAWLGAPTIKVSWEPACNIQQHLIKEFESEMIISTQDLVDSDYGKKTCITIATVQNPGAPVAKKSRSSASTSQPSNITYVYIYIYICTFCVTEQ